MTYKLYAPTLEKIEGSVICIMDGKETVYSNVKAMLDQDFAKKYEVACISVKNGCIAIELAESSIVPNDLSADWAKGHMENTGSEISFF